MGRRKPSRARHGAGKSRQSGAERRGLGLQPQPLPRYGGTDPLAPVLYRNAPRIQLGGLVERIAATRGSGIAVRRASEVLIRDPDGNTRRLARNSQLVYTHDIAGGSGETVVIDAGELPDVVLDADDTAAALHRKLSLYEKWGFPEVWVVVPDQLISGRREGAPRVAIHLRTRVGYVRAPRSAALPSWSAEEIHTALNEPEGLISDATTAALRRVGRLMRADADMGPDDDPILPAEEGEVRVEPTMEDRIEALDEMFGLRGLAVSPSFTDRVAALERPLPLLLRAVYECLDEDDFLERIRVVREIPLIL